jgi:hypothetical protein
LASPFDREAERHTPLTEGLSSFDDYGFIVFNKSPVVGSFFAATLVGGNDNRRLGRRSRVHLRSLISCHQNSALCCFENMALVPLC